VKLLRPGEVTCGSQPISSATPMAMKARIAATLRMANQNSNSPKFFTRAG
jgi:hypothetical protein